MTIEKAIKDNLTNKYINEEDTIKVRRSTLRTKPSYASQTNEMYIDEDSTTYHTHRENLAEVFTEFDDDEKYDFVEAVVIDSDVAAVRFGRVGEWSGLYSVKEKERERLENIIY